MLIFFRLFITHVNIMVNLIQKKVRCTECVVSILYTGTVFILSDIQISFGDSNLRAHAHNYLFNLNIRCTYIQASENKTGLGESMSHEDDLLC